MRRFAVIGLGNLDRGNGAVGILVVRALGGRVPANVALLENGDALSILEEWKKFDVVILVDEVRYGLPPGTVQVFDGRRLPFTVRAGLASTLGYSAREIIDLGGALGSLPAIVRLVGIEAEGFESRPMSGVQQAVAAAVAAAVEVAVEVVLQQIAEIGHE